MGIDKVYSGQKPGTIPLHRSAATDDSPGRLIGSSFQASAICNPQNYGAHTGVGYHQVWQLGAPSKHRPYAIHEIMELIQA
ncbi:7910_t:CDS:2 [Paraglomus brasilianum]|uniref:7910_t:CDS:1 n=1 Tax=Paraglomus brasilianum TaxID=144538 RepID=A0A9N8YY10_9GLOM|nr:7910_t:CDS:2 [Paraglomus brasilianum]